MQTSRLSRLAPALLVMLLGLLGTSQARADFGLSSAGASLSGGDGQFSRQAGAHADFSTHLDFNLKGANEVDGNVRDVIFDLPPGIVGNATIAPTCEFDKLILNGSIGAECPVGSAIGWVVIKTGTGEFLRKPLTNMVPPAGAPALFAFNYFGAAVRIEPRVRPTDYGISAYSVAVSQAVTPMTVDVTLWGVPADPSHDLQRANSEDFPVPSPEPRTAFLSNPTSCAPTPTPFKVSVDSWQSPGAFVGQSFDTDLEGTPFIFTGCEKVPFHPAAKVTQGSRVAAAPIGLEVGLEVPQSDAPDALASAHVKKTVVTFPEGFSVSPSSATGQGACSEAEIGIGSNAAPTCPDSSRIGTVAIKTPLLDEELTGGLYLAEPHRNPFGSLLATYLAVKGPGFYLKLPGEVEADPETGQLTASFEDQPQLPYESVSVSLRGGAGAPLVAPSACGTYETRVEMTSWASPEPVTLTAPIAIDQGCATGGFTPSLQAGTTNPLAGAYSPFVLRLTRSDGEQNISRVEATLPEGLLAKLAGVPTCGEAEVAGAVCPAASQVGRTTVGAGAGPTPLYLPEAGKEPTAVYLAGPYKGAPYSLLFKVPAQAGPFDLGTVAVRAGIYLDPRTAQVTAVSDPLPQILEGIPVAYRDLRVEIDRPEFTLNPTDCDPSALTSTITSAQGATANPSPRFGVAGCEGLGFKPRLRLALEGPVHRRAHPSLRATLTARPGDANIARAQVKLPPSAFLDNAHIGTPCTRVQFAARACPPDSIIGKAEAISPLLGYPVTGAVYLRTNPAHKLPDLVADLRGPDSQPIEVELAGKTDSVKGALRNTFEAVPDVSVTRFNLTLFGGKRGLIIMSAGFCRDPRADIQLTGQNGAEYDTTPKVAAKCSKKHKAEKPHKRSEK